MFLISAAAIIAAFAYVGLLGYTVYRFSNSVNDYWLAAGCGVSMLLSGALFLDGLEFKILGIAPGIWLALVSVSGMCVLGALTFSYFKLKGVRAWLLGLVPLLGLVLAANFLDEIPRLTELTWREALRSFSLSAIIAAIIWAGIGVSLLLVTLSQISKARLPLYANRGLWWGLILPGLMIGEAVAVWAPDLISTIGQGARVIAFVGLVYGITTQNLIDVRGLFRGVVGNAVFIVLNALVTLLGIGAAFFILQQYQGGEKQIQGQLLVVVIALVLALVSQVLHSLLKQVVQEAVFKAGYDTAATAAEYSKRIAQIVDLGELALIIGKTLTDSVEATKSALLLLTPYNGNVRAEVFVGSGQLPTVGHRFPATTPFLTYLARARKPLLQYTLEVSDQFKSMLPIDRRWLQRLGTDTYVPIMDGNTLIGVIAVGSRKSGDPYRARELELLRAVGDQTAVALQNARLVTDLRASNEEVRALNETLETRNEQLKEMDKVKTDFITIASHELRTPLTQILGYADLLKMMSEAPSLSGLEIEPISESVLKAGYRLNEVVTQMLDVSQLDVEALQLNIETISVEEVVTQAVEPFAEALKERRLNFSARDIATLPSIEGDPARLAQAFRQLISNAIKFTPDGGSIQVLGRCIKENRQVDSVEVIVADTGVGISPHYRELVFEKFFRAGSTTLHSTGATKFMGAGPGLGLPIAKGIIEAHGGKIWAESPGYNEMSCPGTQMHILLPLHAVVASKNSAA